MTDDTDSDRDPGDDEPAGGDDAAGATGGGTGEATTDGETTGGTAEDADAAPREAVDRLARRLEAEGKPYARVTVVRREPPVSATVGDRAIVTPDGELTGWIGGVACAQSVAVREATRAIRADEPALVGLAPDPSTIDRPGLAAFPMTCHSGGTLELFVEPVTPTPRLVVVGDSPVARAVARLAGELTYDVVRVVDDADVDPDPDPDPDPDGDGDGNAGDETGPAPGGDPPAPDDRPDPADWPGADEVVAAGAVGEPVDPDALARAIGAPAAVVVATMGAFDEPAVEAGLRTGAPYVGLVASRKRAAALAEAVGERLGRDPDQVAAAVTAPAGLDLGARTPEEIATSVLAELVAVRRSDEGTATAGIDAPESDGERGDDGHEREGGAGEPRTAVDPVCGMTVEVGEAAATVEHEGATYHFCGQGCADAFVDEPTRFLEAAEADAEPDGGTGEVDQS